MKTEVFKLSYTEAEIRGIKPLKIKIKHHFTI